MFLLVLSAFIAFVVLLFAEGVLRHAKWRGTPEMSRKIVHLAHGLAVASWPFFVSYKTIIIVETVFLALVLIARKLHIFRSITDVDRMSWGEVFFPLGIIFVAVLQPSHWIFAAAVLHLGIADAIAALVGKAKGKRHPYKVFGHTKTFEGSAAFMAVSILITAWVLFIVPANLNPLWQVVVWLPILATLAEAVTPWGLDNLVLPLLVMVILNSMQILG